MTSEPVTDASTPPEQRSPELTPDQLAQATKWLETHWTKPACPFHETTQWVIGDRLIQTMTFAGGNLVIGGATYPLLPVTCSICGYTVFVNALLMGLIQRQDDQAGEPA